MPADLPNKSDKKQNAPNTELWEFNTELKVISRYVYKADLEPEILYVTTCTTHFIQMIVLFSLKKKIS